MAICFSAGFSYSVLTVCDPDLQCTWPQFTVHPTDNSEGFDLRQGAVSWIFEKRGTSFKPIQGVTCVVPFMGFEEVNLCHSLE
jgi:hypothetical protein